MKILIKYFKKDGDTRERAPFMYAWFHFNESIWRNSFDIVYEIKKRQWNAFQLPCAPGFPDGNNASEHYILLPPLGHHPAIMIPPLTS
jgi:hypothetical protein